MRAIPKAVFYAALAAALVLGCGKGKNDTGKGDCLSRQPKDLSGLTVSGVRSRSNVVHELWKLTCAMRAYHAAERADIKGMIQVKFTVDFNGEIGHVEIVSADIDDKEFITRVIRILEAGEFSFWGAERDDTEILYTIRFPG